MSETGNLHCTENIPLQACFLYSLSYVLSTKNSLMLQYCWSQKCMGTNSDVDGPGVQKFQRTGFLIMVLVPTSLSTLSASTVACLSRLRSNEFLAL